MGYTAIQSEDVSLRPAGKTNWTFFGYVLFDHSEASSETDARRVIQHVADLWGYDVLMKEIDPATDAVLKEHAAAPRSGIISLDAP